MRCFKGKAVHAVCYIPSRRHLPVHARVVIIQVGTSVKSLSRETQLLPDSLTNTGRRHNNSRHNSRHHIHRRSTNSTASITHPPPAAMAELLSHYFHTSLYAFTEAARSAVIASFRNAVKDDTIMCTYLVASEVCDGQRARVHAYELTDRDRRSTSPARRLKEERAPMARSARSSSSIFAQSSKQRNARRDSRRSYAFLRAASTTWAPSPIRTTLPLSRL